MRWILFLDDIRFPVDINVTFNDQLVIIARSMDDAVWYIQRYGIPYQIHFDHDLAHEHYINNNSEKTGYSFAKWFCNWILTNKLTLPEDFEYFVHSQNISGAENIRCYMNKFLKRLINGQD